MFFNAGSYSTYGCVPQDDLSSDGCRSHGGEDAGREKELVCTCSDADLCNAADRNRVAAMTMVAVWTSAVF